jgi:hypothetical protein
MLLLVLRSVRGSRVAATLASALVATPTPAHRAILVYPTLHALGTATERLLAPQAILHSATFPWIAHGDCLSELGMVEVGIVFLEAS